jgi:hypothetical protein
MGQKVVPMIRFTSISVSICQKRRWRVISDRVQAGRTKFRGYIDPDVED